MKRQGFVIKGNRKFLHVLDLEPAVFIGPGIDVRASVHQNADYESLEPIALARIPDTGYLNEERDRLKRKSLGNSS